MPDRIALVTGGSRGIGRATALALADSGRDVAISYAHDDAQADDCVEAIRARGRRALAVRSDATDHDAQPALVAAVEAELGAVDTLILNAGCDWDGTPVAETRVEDLARVMRMNALVAHQLCGLVLPGMRRAARGDIVMVSSTVTDVLGAGYAPYAMSKAALEALAFVLAKEERTHGIHVNVVAPGLVEAGMGLVYMQRTGVPRSDASPAGSGAPANATFTERERELDRAAIAAQLPFGRICQPEEVASVIAFLVSDAAAYVSGQLVYVDGGGN